MNAPYTGGRVSGTFTVGERIFAVDGDFTVASPCSPPVIAPLFKGDTIFSSVPVWVYDQVAKVYVPIVLGNPGNIQPWNPNQFDISVEQKFMVAQSAYTPMRLNTPYDVANSLGWLAKFSDGSNVSDNNGIRQGLGATYLVDESQLDDVGCGISVFTRKWISIPKTRSIIEQYPMTYPGLSVSSTPGADDIINLRSGFTRNVISRVQQDFFIFDDWNVVALPLFTNGGQKLNSVTGIYPLNMILPKFEIYSISPLNSQDNVIVDNVMDSTIYPTNPTGTDYKNMIGVTEIIAESSTLAQFMGNIYVRKTRFVLVQ